MNENIELIKDYKDCCDIGSNIDTYNYKKIFKWTCIKYENWITKYPEHALSVTVGINSAKDDREKAMNGLNNLKIVLNKIAIIKNIDFKKIYYKII